MPILLHRVLTCLALSLTAGMALADEAQDCRSDTVAPAARRAACDAAIEAASDPAERAGFLIRRARTHLLGSNAEGEDETLADLQEAERLVPGMEPEMRADLLVERSEVYRMQKNFDAALADIEEAERLDPNDADPVLNRGMVLLDQGEREAGDAQIARARELEPDHLRARLHSMYAAMEAEDLETCVEHGTHAVGIEPEDSRILAARARCLAELGRADEALADLARAEEIEPWATFVLDDMAIAYLALDRPDDAITAVRRALEIDPKFEDGHYDLISALMAKGQHEEAMAAFREFQKVVPEDRIGLANNLSWEFYLAGRYEESLQIVEEWLAAYPEPVDEPNHIANPEGYGFVVDTVAHDYAALGRDEEAVQAFLRAAKISSEELRPMYEERLAALGHKPEPGEAGLEAALRACVATREACKLYPQE